MSKKILSWGIHMKTFSKLHLIFIFSLFFSACSHLETRQSLKQKAIEPDPHQAVLIDEGIKPEPPSTTEAEGTKKLPKLGIVLGPGSVKAFAHTGVIKELVQAGIPISYIVGIEWGALVGGLYAINEKINDTEWKLYKLQSKKLDEPGWFESNKKTMTIHSYDDFFAQNLAELNIDQLKIPFACPSISIWSGTIVWQEAGPLKRAVERCMPSPPLFQPKGPWMAALFSSEEAIEFLRKKGMDVVLFVDVLGKSQPLTTKQMMSEFTSSLLWQELKNDLARIKTSQGIVKIEPNTLKFHIYDFSARSSLSAAGVQAGQKAADILVENYDF